MFSHAWRQLLSIVIGLFDCLIKELCHAFNVLVLVGQKAFENVGLIFLNCF